MDYAWWQTRIIYQIYPRSFKDANGDGVGDLRGILEKLDYIKSLGVGVVWLSPIYPSPMYDFGYDISDYTNIHSLFGSLEDFDRLLEAAHERDLKVILDLVPNHTSTEHPWFLESRNSHDNPKRDWYIWRDPSPDGGPPNNWLSFFGGSAWEWDETTGQYYLHLFDKTQPDLNWRNPQVKEAMYSVMRFWLDRGVDGFRVDVIWVMIKDALFRDNPPNPDWKEGDRPWQRLEKRYSEDQPEVHEIVREMRGLLDSYGERVMIGEIYLPVERLVRYYGEGLDEAHLPFNFQLVLLPWDALVVREAVNAYEAALPEGAWPNWVLGNHDQRRIATRVGRKQARVANMLLLTLRGTPTTYYGEEIGMENVPVPPERVRDPQAVNSPEVAHLYGRDPARTPMQWTDGPNAGFAAPEAEPWLPVAEDYHEHNVEAQEGEPTSMLGLYRALTRLRGHEPALLTGAYTPVNVGESAAEVFAYTRTGGSSTFLVVLNFGSNAHTLELSGLGDHADIAVATDMERSGRVGLSGLELHPDEGLVLRLH